MQNIFFFPKKWRVLLIKCVWGINKDFYVIYALSDTQGRARATYLRVPLAGLPEPSPPPNPIITVKK